MNVFLRRLDIKMSGRIFAAVKTLAYTYPAFLAYLLMLSLLLLLSTHIYQTSVRDKTDLTKSNELVSLDFSMRKTLSLFNDNMISLFWVLSDSDKSGKFDSTLKSSFDTNDYVGYFIERLQQARSRLEMSLEAFLTDHHVEGFHFFISSDDTKLMQNPTDYVRGIYVRMQLSVDYMTRIRPFVANKEPPFALDPALKSAIPLLLDSTITVLKNSFELYLPVQRKLIDQIYSGKIEANSKRFKKYFWIYTGCFLLSVVLFAFFCYLTKSWIGSHLQTLLMSYQFLRPEEIDLQLQIINSNIIRLESNKFNEPKIVDYFMDKSKLPLESVLRTHIRHKFKLGSSIITQVQTKKPNQKSSLLIKINKDKTFQSSKLSIFFSIIAATIVVVFLSWFLSESYSINRNHSFVQLYFDNYLKFIPVSNNYLSFINLLIFGNYVKIDGKYYLTSAENNSLRQVAFGDVCAGPQAKKNELTAFAEELAACRKYIPSQKGITGVMIEEFEQMDSKLFKLKTTHQAWLANTKSEMHLSPETSELYFEPELVMMRNVHQIALDSYFGQLKKFIEKRIGRISTETTKTIIDLDVAAILISLAFVLCFFVATKWVFLKDLIICSQTYFIIHPHVLSKNSMLQRSLDQYYSLRNK